MLPILLLTRSLFRLLRPPPKILNVVGIELNDASELSQRQNVLDYLHIDNRQAKRFEQLTEPTKFFIEAIERVASAPVSLISTGFGDRVIIDRRSW